MFVPRSKRGRPADDSKKQEKDRGLYHCDYCAKDLSHVPRIKCAVCPDYDLCMECFSVGAQVWPHANDHAYRVVDNLSFPLYHPEWGADEELLLLEAIDMYGLGNWGPDPLHRLSVADHVGMKTGAECRAHYYSIYVETDCFPEPKPAPEMAYIDIPRLIEAHRSSAQHRSAAQQAAGQQQLPKKPRMTSLAQSLPAAVAAAHFGAAGPAAAPSPAVPGLAAPFAVPGYVVQYQGTPAARAALADVPAGQQPAAAALPPGVKVESVVESGLVKAEGDAGAVPGPTGTAAQLQHPQQAGKTPAGQGGQQQVQPPPESGLVEQEAGSAAAGQAQKAEQRVMQAPGGLPVKAEPDRSAAAIPLPPEHGQLPTAFQPAAAGAAADQMQAQQHQQQVGEKGRQHAMAVARHQVAEAQGAQQAAAAAAAAAAAGSDGAGGAAAGAAPAAGTSVAGADEAHASTATFGLRLRAASSYGEESLGLHAIPSMPSLSHAPSGAGFATPGYGMAAGGHPAGSAAAAAAGKMSGEGGPGGAAAAIGTSDAQQTGYHVKRNEFDPEYDNEAESIVAELEFSPSDTPEQVAQKLRLVEIYNRRLDERERRKAFVLERGLLNVRKQQAADRRRSAAERELQARLRVFARYLPQDQFEVLAEGLAVEARLRARILELQDFRRNGLRTFEQVDELESILGEGAAGGRKAKEGDKPPPTSKSRPQRAVLDEAALQSELMRLRLPHAAAHLETLRTTLCEGKGTSTALQAWRARRGVLLDITSLPDAEALTQKERALCSTERYLPAQYLAVKAALLKIQEGKGHVSRADVKQLPFQVDPARLLRLLDFMSQHGWVCQVP
ncbi:hypothetical protein N2152v2_009904 [Parachlorella kessleri]